MKVSFLAGAALILTGCATAPSERVNEAAAAKLAEFDRTGEKVSCLNSRRITKITAVDERTFLVRASGDDYYVNEVSGRCNGATGISTRFEYTISTGQLCRNDILRVVENSTGGFVRGSCGLGSFEKLAPKPAAE